MLKRCGRHHLSLNWEKDAILVVGSIVTDIKFLSLDLSDRAKVEGSSRKLLVYGLHLLEKETPFFFSEEGSSFMTGKSHQDKFVEDKGNK
ncbi:hypothetical protein Tco_0115420 [Tanacetum coccineum]